jgi:hypothetical protein
MDGSSRAPAYDSSGSFGPTASLTGCHRAGSRRYTKGLDDPAENDRTDTGAAHDASVELHGWSRAECGTGCSLPTDAQLIRRVACQLA